MIPKRGSALQPMQTGFVVDDMISALRYWTEVIGAGPFFVMEAREWRELTYKGAPTNVHMRLAIGQWGPMQLEFIEQLNDAPSPYLDFLAAGRRGLHHFGVLVDNLEAELAAFASRGKEVVFRGSTAQDFRFAYLVDDEHPGSMIELMERGVAADELSKMIKDAAQNWDGRDPIRVLS